MVMQYAFDFQLLPLPCILFGPKYTIMYNIQKGTNVTFPLSQLVEQSTTYKIPIYTWKLTIIGVSLWLALEMFNLSLFSMQLFKLTNFLCKTK